MQKRASHFAFFFALGFLANASSPAHQPPGAIVVDASEFYHEIPAGDSIGLGGGGRGTSEIPWLFNNSALNLQSKEDTVAKIAVPEAGIFRLFVRSMGSGSSSFQISIDGKRSESTFGNGPLAWKGAETFQLKKGAID